MSRYHGTRDQTWPTLVSRDVPSSDNLSGSESVVARESHLSGRLNSARIAPTRLESMETTCQNACDLRDRFAGFVLVLLEESGREVQNKIMHACIPIRNGSLRLASPRLSM